MVTKQNRTTINQAKQEGPKISKKIIELKPGRDYIGVGGGVLVVNDDNEVLLLKRSANAKNEIGYWNKPGGSVEFGETVWQAMEREVMEEIGVEVELIKFVGFTDHIIPEDEQHWVGFNYVAKIKNGEPKIMEPHKHDEMRWFKLDELPEKVSPPTVDAINEYLLLIRG